MATGSVVPVPPQPNAEQFGAEPLVLLLLLRAFASGSVALTGVEAIANGVPAFKPPEARNAANTMIAMAVLLGVIFVGISIVALAYGVVPSVGGYPSVVSLVAGAVYGAGSILHIVFLVATMLILFLAANTSYNAFPRLAALLAIDGYMPRQFSFRGDRLAYSWGIVLLAAVAVGLVALFGGTTTLLIPLYAVGVFVCFSLSQTGMVRHWLRLRDARLATPTCDQRLRRPRHDGRPGDRGLREVLCRGLPRRDPDPDPRGDDAVHPSTVPRLGRPARDRSGCRAPATESR